MLIRSFLFVVRSGLVCVLMWFILLRILVFINLMIVILIICWVSLVSRVLSEGRFFMLLRVFFMIICLWVGMDW